MSFVPRSLDDIDESWFTVVLGQGCPELRVRDCVLEEVVHGTSTKARYRLSFDGDSGDVPPVLWVKAGLEAHDDLANLGIYATEPRIYADVLPRVEVRAPKSYFSMVDEASLNGVLVLEDLVARGVTFGNYKVSPSLESIRSQLSNFAGLHARWQSEEELTALKLVPVITRGTGTASYFEANGPDVIAHYLETERCAKLPDSLRDPERIYAALWALAEHMQRGPHVVVHGDAHVGNSYYEPSGLAGMYDWQMVRRGSWAHDVTLFMTTAMTVEDRRAHERELVQFYLDEVARRGGRSIGFDEAFDDYRHYIAYGLFCKIVNKEYFQAEFNNVISVERFGAAAEEHDLFEVLGV